MRVEQHRRSAKPTRSSSTRSALRVCHRDVVVCVWCGGRALDGSAVAAPGVWDVRLNLLQLFAAIRASVPRVTLFILNVEAIALKNDRGF